MVTDDELYAGFPKEQAEAYRQEAVAKYGAEAVEKSENHLRKMSKAELAGAKAEGGEIARTLAGLMHNDTTDPVVQQQIARHFAHIKRMWGNAVSDTRAAYRGLAQLYVDDLRYTSQNGELNPDYAQFVSKAMIHFANSNPDPVNG